VSAAPQIPAARGLSRCLRLARVLVAAIALVVALGLAGWYERVQLLRTAADWWVVSDPVGPADAVAVFGGGLEDRPFAAAEYYREGLVKKILVSNPRESRTEQLGIFMPHAAANRAVLMKLGVPAEAIETFGTDLATTHEEALALREWAGRNGAHRIIVPTETFAARRLRWVLHRVFRDDTVIRVPAIDPPEFRQAEWWRHETGLLRFQNEVLKYIYYRLNY
jgi:uncharacterized SAM-binding protein YcdF (DUF218 family)